MVDPGPWITLGPPNQPGTSIVLYPPAATPGITDDERRTIAEVNGQGNLRQHQPGHRERRLMRSRESGRSRDTALAMSQENVEIVRSAYEAYERGDLAGMLKDTSAEMVTYRADPDGAIFRGPEGFLQALAEWTEEFDDFTATAEEFIDANENQVVVRVHQVAIGAQSGTPIAADFWFVHTMSDGKGTRVDIFASESQALEAAGPRE
jgi:ketosteroid isomerase-like protein